MSIDYSINQVKKPYPPRQKDPAPLIVEPPRGWLMWSGVKNKSIPGGICPGAGL